MAGESILAVIAIVLMLATLALSVIPLIPGPALVWAIGVIFAALDGFTHVTWVGVAIMTLLMILGSTANWWMSALGMRASGSSCLGILGSMVGGLIGTFAAPVPIIGTLIGAVIGAVLLEFLHFGEWRTAVRAGGSAVKGYCLGTAVEFALSVAIFLVFVVSLAL